MYYTIARPETLVSIVNAGRLPDNLPNWVLPREILLFDNPQKSIATTSTNFNQTFVLEIDMPHETEDTFYHGRQLELKWIKKIYVYSKTSENLVNKLLSHHREIPLQIVPGIFPTEPAANNYKNDSCITQPKLMKYVLQGDLLTSDMQTLVNTVNCVGVMGKGIALSFERCFPAMFEDYKKKCRNGEVKIGEPYLYKVTQSKWIINFPTKKHWRENSELRYVESGLKYLAEHIVLWGITSLAIPPLGCGNGGLDWKIVQPLIEKHLSMFNIQIEVYGPLPKLTCTGRKRGGGAADLLERNSYRKSQKIEARSNEARSNEQPQYYETVNKSV